MFPWNLHALRSTRYETADGRHVRETLIAYFVCGCVVMLPSDGPPHPDRCILHAVA